MLTKILRTIRTVIIIIGCLLLFQIVINVMQTYQVLQNAHPVLGALFALVLATACVASVTWYIITLQRHPLTLRPPPRQELDKANTKELQAYGRYLCRIMQRLARNERLPENNRVALESEDGRLREILANKSDLSPMIDAIRGAEELHIQPAIEMLDDLAKREVRGCVRDVMLGVTLSPWRAADLLVVLYRNAGLVVRITGIYNNSPRLREHFLIMRDVITVVATVNFLNYGSKLMQNLLTSVPFLGRFTDDVVQGVGAGLMTSLTGHTALMRCRAFHGWNESEAQDLLRNQLGQFLVDIKKILFDDILTELYKPVKALNPDIASKPGWLDRLRDEVASSIDDTTDAMDYYFKQPTVVAGREIAKTGSEITKSTYVHTGRLFTSIKSGAIWLGRKAGKKSEATKRAKQRIEGVNNKQQKSRDNGNDT